jgi:DNA-binding transcriptional MerR regulator
LGVSESTLRSWELRYGVRPSLRTAGGHRRYTNDDLARLQRIRQLQRSGMSAGSAAASVARRDGRDGRATGKATPARSDDALVAQLSAAAGELDERDLVRTVRRLLAQRGTALAWTTVFAPTLRQIGQTWERTGGGIECEHVLTSVLLTELHEHALARTGRKPARTSPVLLAATEREMHTLPLFALAGALSDAGRRSCVLGAVPRQSLCAAVDRARAGVVLVWARSADTADPALLRRLRRDVPLVCAAGPGWSARTAPPVTDDLAGAVDFIGDWLG